ncbi:hypothetical protein B1757_13845 [Acidithiobacillus marinus]|uniref:Uncharacterized protein n=1 Tax=Acidithiobacillus marinus TaxID=187490 RepID=A0A2I1DII2_9PROT|nr:hypothetical protein [Acidithiobacillus marinus]PKY09681.1 hypothetical protein B1757_13845 [Acidithiobacillus marinus]
MEGSEEKCVGYIQLVYFDIAADNIVILGGAGFASSVEAAWDNITEFSGKSSFMADLMDDEWSIVKEKQISAETCECLMGKPIAQLIAEGRAKLAKDYPGPD